MGRQADCRLVREPGQCSGERLWQQSADAQRSSHQGVRVSLPRYAAAEQLGISRLVPAAPRAGARDVRNITQRRTEPGRADGGGSLRTCGGRKGNDCPGRPVAFRIAYRRGFARAVSSGRCRTGNPRGSEPPRHALRLHVAGRTRGAHLVHRGLQDRQRPDELPADRHDGAADDQRLPLGGQGRTTRATSTAASTPLPPSKR